MGRETTDLTLFAGVKLWEGAEFWTNPELDQGFGVGNPRLQQVRFAAARLAP